MERDEGGVADDVPAALDAKLCFDVYATNLAFARLYAPLLEPAGLTYPQFLVLSLLWDEGETSLADLSAAMDLKSSTMTPLLKRMAQAGLVERTRETTDERRVRITLTDAGSALRHTLADVPECVERATGLPDSELRALQRTLRILRRNLGG